MVICIYIIYCKVFKQNYTICLSSFNERREKKKIRKCICLVDVNIIFYESMSNTQIGWI